MVTLSFRRHQLKSLIWFLLLNILSPELQAQKNSVSLQWGAGFYARQDQTFSPFVHTDWSLLNIGGSYVRTAKWKQFADVQFGLFNPILVPSYTYDTDKQTYPHNFTLVNVSYGLGKQLKYADEKHKLYAGGLFEADIEPSSYNYGWSSSFGYFASISLGGWLAYEYTPDLKNYVSVKTSIPLLSLVARSPYLVNDDAFIENTYSHSGFKTFFEYLADGKMQTLNRIQQFELQLNYRRFIGPKWQVGGGYEFRFIHASLPTTFLSYRNTFFVSVTYPF